MARLIISLFLFFISTQAWATTWYIRPDGGSYGVTSTTCNGLYDSSYSSGNGPNCSVNSIFQIHTYTIADGSDTHGTERISGGDTIIFDDNGSHFPMGYVSSGIPASCTAGNSYGCYLKPIPDGTSNNYTKIYGSNYTNCTSKAQLYGSQGIRRILDLSGTDYVDIECLEITDHDNCGFRLGTNQCSESYSGGVTDYGRDGIFAVGGSNFVFKNLDIHGLAYRALNMGGQTNINMSHVNIDGNPEAGWDGDVGETGGQVITSPSYIDGTIIIDHVKTRFNGCIEAYPRSSSFSTSDYSGCVDSNNSGYGDGWGFYFTGGTWKITNSEWSHNAQDGLDLLYHDGTGDVYIDKSLFEGNTGNQLKVSTRDLNVENSIILGNCGYIKDASKNAYAGFTSCRAGGDPISLTVTQGSNFKFLNDTLYNHSGYGFLYNDRYHTCDGTEIYSYSNITGYSDVGNQLIGNSLSGSCSTALNNGVFDHSDIYNFTSVPSGTGVVTTDIKWSGTISSSSDSNVSNVYLTSSSPGKGSGTTNAFWNNSKDYNNYPQNVEIDMGALQYNSVSTCITENDFCSSSSDCCSGNCSANVCVNPINYSSSATGNFYFNGNLKL